ncbi:MAG TPA: thioredoxin domain-containing protein [Phycisphaerae bacterium]|nr:thioredoxin domain-containing protein [Phycisphaerae bacterium]
MQSDPPPPPARALSGSATPLSPLPPIPSRWTALRVIALALALGGAGICGLLQRMSGGGGSVFGANLCTPTQAVNCDFVLASRWAKIGPFPSAALGVAYFGALAAWLAFVGFANRAGRGWHLVPLGLAAVGLCGSAYFIYVMAVHLPVWCTWCIAAHVVNALLFLAILGGWPRRPSADALDVAPYPSAGRALAVVAGCGAAAAVVLSVVIAVGAQVTAAQMQREFMKIGNNVDYIAWRYSMDPSREIALRSDDLAAGPADAAHTVVIFEDFQCKGCAELHRFTALLLKSHPKLRIVYKHYPMSGACNRHARMGSHYFACEAAQAAEAARLAGTTRQAHHFASRLFENFGRLDERPYASLAAEVGIDTAKFAAALAGPEPAARVAEDIELAHALGVESTPAVFLNGRKLWNWNILTTDARPKVDLAATEGLWERLIGEQKR